ncbi:MAG: PspC domain-containing protein [Flavobacterium sp.]
MNKTVSINLGGLFFHIDEDAYQKLNRYFDAIRKSLSPDGRDEIMNDIEGRIAELLTEMLKNDKQVAGIKEIDEVIAVMGEPEDYRIDDEPTQEKAYNYTYPVPPVKKFYLDGDRAIVAGVCAGVGHYFRIDPLWVRIIFIASLIFTGGMSAIIYVLLWILIPKAITTTEKLEMVGEPINISNIEKKVKQDIDQLASRINNYDYEKVGNSVGKGAERVGNAIGDILTAIFNVIAKIIGAILVVITAVWLGCMLAMLVFVCFSNTMPEQAWYPALNVFNYTNAPLWILAVLAFFAIGIPVFFLFLLGLKILVNNLKPVGQITRYTFLAVWVLSVAALIYYGLTQATEVSTESTVSKREEIYMSKEDTLTVKFRRNDDYSNQFNEYSFAQDSMGRRIIRSNNIIFHFRKTDEQFPYVKVDRSAWGNSLQDARRRADNIKYGYEVLGPQLILDDYMLLGNENKFRKQRVNVYLYLPEGTKVKPDSSIQNYDWTDNSFFDLHFDGDYIYQMGKENARCLDCPANDDLPEGAVNGEDGEDIQEKFESRGGNINYEDEHVNLKVDINNDSINIKTSSKNRRR